MNPHLVMGLFALYVVAVSLLRLLADREYPRLTAMKRVWGRRRGLAMHFLSNVALPLVFGIVFFSRGLTGAGGAPVSCDPLLQSVLARYAATAETQIPLANLVSGLSQVYDCELGEVERSPSRPPVTLPRLSETPLP